MPKVQRRGLMFVLSSPSGAGKSTISRALLERHDDLTLSVSATTRLPRTGEVDGVDYRFMSAEDFQAMVDAGDFLEHAKVFDNFYGTPRGPVEEVLASGRDVLFDIDWQGTQQLYENAPKDLVAVFILPPSVEELERRLYSRAQDSEEVVKKRMAKAGNEMSHWPEYNYIVVNENLEDSIDKVESILKAERLKRDRQLGLSEFVNTMRGED